MHRLVLDTNILVSALIRKNTAPYQLYQAWQEDEFELVTSYWQVDELKRVITYKKLQRFFTADEARRMLAGALTVSLKCI